MHRRNSDRWMTPAVVVVLILSGAAVICTAIAGVVFLQYLGRDPDPMLKLAAQIATGVGSLGTLILTLTTRATVTKVEQNTGTLPDQVTRAIEDALYEPPVPAPEVTSAMPPVPVPLPPGYGAAPAAGRR